MSDNTPTPGLDETNERSKTVQKTQFGDTVPYFKIAQHFGLDYGDVLMLADFITHGRISQHELKSRGLGQGTPMVVRINEAMTNQGRSSELLDFDMAMRRQLRRFTEIQSGAPY